MSEESVSLIPVVNEEGVHSKNDVGDELYFNTKENCIIAVPVQFEPASEFSQHDTESETPAIEEGANVDDNVQSDCEMQSDSEMLSDGHWSDKDILRLISTYKEFSKHLQNAKKKKKVWGCITAKLKQLGSNRDSDKCQRKWLNLMKSYKKIKDNNKQTGRGELKKFKYYEELDVLLCKKPSCKEPSAGSTLDLGLEVITMAKDKIIEQQTNVPETLPGTKKRPAEGPVDAVQAKPHTLQVRKAVVNEVVHGVGVQEAVDSDCNESNKRTKRRNTGNREYFSKKLEYLTEIEYQKKLDRENKEKRHTERMEIERRRLELEEMKIKALEELAQLTEKDNLSP